MQRYLEILRLFNQLILWVLAYSKLTLLNRVNAKIKTAVKFSYTDGYGVI